MPKAFPVGTIRHWEGGDVIKAHDPTPPYSGGWITLKTSPKFDALGRECDMYARDVLNFHMPINGEKFLDHEINEFGKALEEGDFFTSDTFKSFEGYYGAGHYAFRNVFSKMFMDNDSRLQEAIHQAYVSANEDAGGNKNNDVLSADIKKAIKDRIRAEFKEAPMRLTEDKARQMLEIVKRTRTQIEEGLDFKDPEKRKIYDAFKKVIDSLPLSYELISKKRLQKFEALDTIETAFFDNWGVRESCKDYAQKMFDEYVRKYADQISKDSLEEQIRMFGVTMDMEPDEFYSKIYEKAANLNYNFLEKYAGREITISPKYGSDSYRVKVFWKEVKAIDDDEQTHNELYYRTANGIERNLIQALNDKDIRLSPEYSEFGSGFKDLIYLRFMKRYNKSVEGDWELEHLPAIHNLENLMNELPAGQFKTNEELYLITNKTYNGGNSGGYAWYSPNERRINLSASCIERSTVWGVLANPTEFKSVFLHEIGHAVDKKLGGTAVYDYKKFVVDMGWTYTQEELRAGMTATGEQKSIPRKGSNNNITPITEYASKSPSEAFAEYYSFYNLNKKAFDKYFETHDHSHLQQASKVVAKNVSSEQTIRQMIPGHRTSAHINDEMTKHWNTYNQVQNLLSDKVQEHTIALNSPWKMTLSTEGKKKLSTKTIKMRKDYSIHSMPPVVAVRNGLERHVIDGGVRMEVARMNKQLVPTLEISKEEYYTLRSYGMNDEQISDCVYTKHREDVVPKQIAPAVTVTGLIYRDNLIPLDVILENYNALKTMKGICESKELQKAMEDLFSKGIYVNDEENRKKGVVGQHYGKEQGISTLTDHILKEVDPLITRIVAAQKKGFEEENGREMNKYDEELLRLTLTYDLVRALNVYTKPTDKLMSIHAHTGVRGTLEINASIQRDGQQHFIHTEAFYAGGHNIQQFHTRYLTETNLPKTGNSQDADKIKEKIQKLTKAEKITQEIKQYHARLDKQNQQLEENKKLTDEDILNKPNSLGRITIWPDWEEIVRRGADVNFDHSKEKYKQAQEESNKRTVDLWKRIHVEGIADNNKMLEQAITKLETKLKALK